MTFSMITQFESERIRNDTNATISLTVNSQEEDSLRQDSFNNNFASSSTDNVSNNNQDSQQFENASSPSSPRGITKKRKNSKNSFIDFPSVITTVSTVSNNSNSTATPSQYQDDMWMQGVLFQFKNSCLCSSYSSSYSIKQKKPSNPTALVSNRRII